MTTSDKIDHIVTNRILALPIFFLIMTLVYFISVTTVGGWATDWVNDTFFGEIVNDAATGFMESIEAPDWMSSLVVDGIIGGVGTVLGFVPQILLISSSSPFWKTPATWRALPSSWTVFP